MDASARFQGCQIDLFSMHFKKRGEDFLKTFEFESTAASTFSNPMYLNLNSSQWLQHSGRVDTS